LKVHLFFERLVMRISYHRHFEDLWIGVLGGKSDDHLLRRLEAALVLIRQHDPVRYKRICRDIDRIWICPLPGPLGSFQPALRRCNLEFRFVGSSSPEVIASTIVHEATHAHPCLRKIGYPEALRYRIEQICMRQELAFASRLPDGGEAREQVERNLTRPPSSWSDAALGTWYLSEELAMARHFGVPDWIIKSSRAIRNARQRLRRVIG